MSGLAADAKIELVETLDDALDMLSWLGETRPFLGVDTETTGLNLGRDRIRLIQFGDRNRGYALDYELWKGIAKTALERYEGQLVFHNLAFDGAFLKRDGIHVPECNVHDTMIMCHLLEPRQAIGLKPAAARYVDKRAWAGKDALSDAFHKAGWNWGTVPVSLPAYWLYSAMDTMLTAALAEKLYPRITPYLKVYETELACIHVLRDARLRGMAIDLDYCTRTRAQLISDLEGLRERIPVDPGKDRQVIELLTHLGQESGRGSRLEAWWPFRTDKGNISVDDDALAAFETAFPNIIPPLREWRTKSRLVSNYFNNIIGMSVNGVLRPNIKHVGARTSRMSVTEPALQTLPRGRGVRDAFVAREGHKLLLADYAQVEARVLASYAGCTAMIDAFIRGEDLHTWTAAEVYEKPQEEVVKQERQISKNVGYANLYGAGIPKIAATAGAPIPAVEAFMGKYDRLFPEIARFKQDVIDEVKRRHREEGDGYVTTILGRRLPVDADKAYKGINYLIQCSATSDVLKKKIVELDAVGLGEYIRLPVHDEVITEVPDDLVGDVKREIERTMPETQLFACPLTIETDVVERWGEHFEEDPTRRYNWCES